MASSVRESALDEFYSAIGVRPVPLQTEVAPFVDGQYVRLRNRGRSGYLFADESGRGVSVDRRRHMVNTVWAVQILQTRRGDVHVLLRGAFGRYLAATRVGAGPGHIGCNAEQRNFDALEDTHVMWSTVRLVASGVMLVNGGSANRRVLRANGRYRRWNRGVTVEPWTDFGLTSMMEWDVQIVSRTVQRPRYQSLRPRNVEPDNGDSGNGDWALVQFYGRCLTLLANELAWQLRNNRIQFQDITLFVRAGALGQPTALLTDLPYRDDTIDIVVFRVGTPGHDGLLFPDLDVE